MTDTKLNCRLATPDDVAALQQFVEAGFKAEDARPDWTADMILGANFTISVEDIFGKVTKPDNAFLIFTDDNTDKGEFAACCHVFKRDDNLARLTTIVVGPKHLNRGIGRKVLEEGEKYCRKEWKSTKVELNALSSRDKLIAWYNRRGYVLTGEALPFPYEEGIELPAGLSLVMLEKNIAAGPAV